ncbi:MAG: DUF302 domain-containing protein [Planctomycetota bacterium]|jgi:uncharacterized protein (DUF302 family)
MSESQETTKKPIRKKTYRLSFLYILIGLVAGVLLTGAAVVTAMPRMMIVTHESRLGFDATVNALEKGIAERGWVVSRVMDMNKSMARHGVEFGPRVKLVKLCKPEYAKSVLTTDRHVSSLMPCTFAVWEGDDGKVYLSKMNMGLMARMFGGNIARIMGGNVARDEQTILSGIIAD